MTFKQNPDGDEGKPGRYLERVLLAEEIMSAKDLMWDLAFLEYGVNDANSIYFFLVSLLTGFDPQSPL